MERKLKFRVWTGNGMEYSVVVGEYGVFYVNPENGTGLDPKDSASLTPCNTKYPDDIPVMQFTGLVDKNGREIYEGDIVKDKYKSIGSVIYHTPYAGFASMIDREEWINTIQLDQGRNKFEVIGNVYENPDLIR